MNFFKKINKKAIFFSFIAMLFATMFLILAFNSTDALKNDPSAAIMSVERSNSFVSGIEGSYFESILKVSGSKAIQAVICEENRSGTYVKNLSLTLKSLVVYGSFSYWPGADQECARKYMGNATFSEHIILLKNISVDKMGIQLNITMYDVVVDQTDARNLFISANFSVVAKGVSASWERVGSAKAFFPIDSFYDPMFSVNTQGNYSNKIVLKPKKVWMINHTINNSEFKDHLENMTYYENPYAPSFLMRLQNLSGQSDCCGISTVINPKKVPNLDNMNQSFVDYQYFGRLKQNCYNNTGLFSLVDVSTKYPGFKLDLYYMTTYNLTFSSKIC